MNDDLERKLELEAELAELSNDTEWTVTIEARLAKNEKMLMLALGASALSGLAALFALKTCSKLAQNLSQVVAALNQAGGMAQQGQPARNDAAWQSPPVAPTSEPGRYTGPKSTAAGGPEPGTFTGRNGQAPPAAGPVIDETKGAGSGAVAPPTEVGGSGAVEGPPAGHPLSIPEPPLQ